MLARDDRDAARSTPRRVGRRPAPPAVTAECTATGWRDRAANVAIAIILAAAVGGTVASSAGPDGDKPSSAQPSGRLAWPGRTVLSARFDPAGGRLVALDLRGDLGVLDLASGRLTPWPRSGRSPITAIAISPDGATIAAADAVGKVTLIGTADGVARATIAAAELDLPSPAVPPDESAPAAGLPIRSLAFDGDGPYLAVGGIDGSIRLWDRAAGRLVGQLRGHAGPVTHLQFGATGRTLVSAAVDGTARVWDRAGGACRRTVARPRAAILSLALSPDEGFLILSCQGGEGKAVLRVDLGPDPQPDRLLDWCDAMALALSPDGRTLAGVGADRRVRLYDLADGRTLLTTAGHPGHIRELAFRPGCGLLAATGADGVVGFYDLPATHGIGPMQGDAAAIAPAPPPTGAI